MPGGSVSCRDVRVAVVGFAPVTAVGVVATLTGHLVDPVDASVISARHALRSSRQGEVELVVFDPARPTIESCFEFCRDVKRADNPPGLLAFGELRTDAQLRFCRLSGCDSFVDAGTAPERLAQVVAATLSGTREWLLGGSDADFGRASWKRSALTPREEEVLWLVSARCTNGQIGRMLGISSNTVKNHVAAVIRKLGVARRTELFAGAIAHGLGGS